jgi:hypothetical protein
MVCLSRRPIFGLASAPFAEIIRVSGTCLD